MSANEILNATTWAEHHLLTRYAETEDGRYGFFREFWAPAPLAIKARETGRIHPVGWSYQEEWNECLERPYWTPYSKCLMNDVRLQAYGKYFAYIEKKGFEDRDSCDLGEFKPDYERIKLLIQHETTQLLKNSSFEFETAAGLPHFWEPTGGALYFHDGGYSGEKCIGVDTTTASSIGYWVSHVFPVKPETLYYFEAFLNGLVKSGRVYFKMEQFDNNGTKVNENYYNLIEGFDTHEAWSPYYPCFFIIHPQASFARIIFGVLDTETNAKIKADDFVLLECTMDFYPWQAVTPCTVTLTVQPLECNSENTIDLYIGGTLCTGSAKPSLVCSDVKTHLHELYEQTLPPFTGYGTAKYCARHSSFELYNQLLLDMTLKAPNELQNMSNKVKALLDDFGFTYDRYYPLYRASDNLPDDYFIMDETAHDISLWKIGGNCGATINGFYYPPSGAPFGPGYYMYWSRVGLCRSLLWAGSFLTTDIASIAYLAVHLMNKYGAQTKSPVWHFSAEDLLLNGFFMLHTECKPLKTMFDGVGFSTDGFYHTTLLGTALIAFSELGYGFNYPEAKTLADQMAQILIQCQLGYPYTTMSTPQNPIGCEGLFFMEKSIHKWENTNESEMINMPDLAGAVPSGYKLDKDGRVICVPRMNLAMQTATNDHITMPFEYGFYPSFDASYYPKNHTEYISWLENTILFHRALHIYHWYKYQGGTGAFPAKVWPPKGVDWLPAVSNMVKVQVT